MNRVAHLFGINVQIPGYRMIFTSKESKLFHTGAFTLFCEGDTVVISGTKNNNRSFQITEKWPDFLILSPAPVDEVMLETDMVYILVNP